MRTFLAFISSKPGLLLLSLGLGIWPGVWGQSPLYVAHWDTAFDPTLSSGSAGAVTTVTWDSACSQVMLSVTDPVNAPLPPFNAYIINPLDSMGNDITDLSGNMQIHARVRSLDTVRMAVLLRSGGGSSSERSDRVEFTVPGDTSTWHDFTFAFDASNLAGFDSTDLRDVWFYLDRGVDNFAGNAFYLDFISIGAAPDSNSWSTCPDTATPPPAPSPGLLYTTHWTSSSDPNLGGTTTGPISILTVDTVCSEISIEVTDPVFDPLPAFSPYTLNPQTAQGNDLTDLSANMRVYMRVRSLDTVKLAVLMRSGGGSSSERTDRIEVTVPGDTLNWYEYTFTFDASNLGGFDSTDLRDVWLYLDRGLENFAGNLFYLDYISIGAKPDASENSNCLDFPYVLQWSDTTDAQFGGTGAATLTQSTDTICSQLAVSVTDAVSAPFEADKPLIITPANSSGNAITNLTGQLNIQTRVRSKGAIQLGFLMRSGDGTAAFRTDLQEVSIPADLSNWTEVEFTVDSSNLGGFDAADLRDIWFYLDKDLNNFAGNEVYFDYISIGGAPDSSGYSVCTGTVSIENDLPALRLAAFPNPIRAGETLKLSFEASLAQDYQIQLFDGMGKAVWQQAPFYQNGPQEAQIPTGGLAAGIYVVSLRTEGQQAFVKVLIQ